MRAELFTIGVVVLTLTTELCTAQGNSQQKQQHHRSRTPQSATKGTNSRDRDRSTQATPPSSFFKPIDLSGDAAVENGTSVVWKETDWTKPSNKPSTVAADWQIYRLQVQGEQNNWDSTYSWVTRCGYLRWDTALRKVQYDAEVDGCQDVWTFFARNIKNNATQSGRVRIIVAVNNCIYSNCEHPGCPDCKCSNTRSGVCGCASGQQGFIGAYSWQNNRNVCAYVPVTAVTDASAAHGLFEAKSGTSKIWVPFKFSSRWGSKCLPDRAATALKVTDVTCKRLTAKLDKRKSTSASNYPGSQPAGTLNTDCSQSNGVYKVVVQVPQQTGQYQCYMTLNDGLNNRPLAELRVKD